MQALAFRAEQEKQLDAHAGCKHADMKKKNLGDVTTVNLTMLQSGVSSDGGKSYALNVVPSEATAGFDIRISPDMDLDKFEVRRDLAADTCVLKSDEFHWVCGFSVSQALLNEWCAAEGVSWEFDAWVVRDRQHYVTSLESADNEWWPIFRGVCEVRLQSADDLTMLIANGSANYVQAQGLQLETEIFPAATDCRFLRKAGIPSLGFSPMNRTPVLLHDHNESLHSDVFLRGIDIYASVFRAMFSHR